MSVPCPLCKRPMQANITAKQSDRVFATLVCDGPHGVTPPVDPRVQHRTGNREAKPL